MNTEIASQSDSNKESVKTNKKWMIFIEGNISSGKSTILTKLQEHGFTVFEEAVSALTEYYKNEKGENILELFYNDMLGYSFKMQMASMNARWEVIKKGLDVLNTTSTDLVIIERSILTDKNSFAINLHKNGYMDKLEWQIYNDSLRNHIEDTKPRFNGINVIYLYLRASPEICLQRKFERGRQEESSLQLDYLQELHKTYDEWLLDPEQNYKTINADNQLKTVLEDTLNFINDLTRI